MRIPRFSRTQVVALAVFATSCDRFINACTLIGCQSGLTIRLGILPTVPYRVEVRSAGEVSPVYTYQCAGTAGRCQQDILFPDFLPNRASVTVVVGTASRTTETDLIQYDTRYPNGKQCGGECRNALVSVPVPN